MKLLALATLMICALVLAAAPMPNSPHVFPLAPAPALYAPAMITSQVLEPAIKSAQCRQKAFARFHAGGAGIL